MAPSERANFDNLPRELWKLYWQGVKRDVCEILLFYDQCQRQGTSLPAFPEVTDVEDNFSRIMNEWDPRWGYLGDRKDRVPFGEIEKDARHQMRESLADPPDQIFARALFQSLGLLDLDILHEFRPPVRTVYEEGPHLERLDAEDSHVETFREIGCANCNVGISTDIYYECTKGCLDKASSERMTGQRSNAGRIFPAMKTCKPSFLKLCSLCIMNIPQDAECERSHLVKKSAQEQYDKYQKEFRKRCSRTPRSKILSVVDTRIFFPAGQMHLALMLGPLVIENGIRDVPGVMISTRPPPSLLGEQPSWLYEEEQQEGDMLKKEVIQIFDNKTDGTRHVAKLSRRMEPRQLLAAVKRVYGAALSSFQLRSRQKEESASKILLEKLNDFQYPRYKPHRIRRAYLHRKAAEIVNILNGFIGGEVHNHIVRLAYILLQPETVLKWDFKTNSCQYFVDQLLKNGRDFEHLFCPLPTTQKPEALLNPMRATWPRYALSFGTTVDLPGQILDPQYRSLIWHFYWADADKLDLIEFAEAMSNKSAKLIKEHPKWIEHIGETPWENLSLRETDDSGTWQQSLIDDLWLLPRDSLSVLQTHLLRLPRKYVGRDGYPLSLEKWMENRLQLLTSIELFKTMAGSMVMAWETHLSSRLQMLEHILWPSATVYGTAYAHESFKAGLLGWTGVVVNSVAGRSLPRSLEPTSMRYLIRNDLKAVRMGDRPPAKFASSFLPYVLGFRVSERDRGVNNPIIQKMLGAVRWGRKRSEVRPTRDVEEIRSKYASLSTESWDVSPEQVQGTAT